VRLGCTGMVVADYLDQPFIFVHEAFIVHRFYIFDRIDGFENPEKF
jgi:hypothetical protein